MIVGMIDVLTVRRACGWVWVEDDPAMALAVRIRDHETIVAQVELHAEPPAAPGGTAFKRPFSIDFPVKLDPLQLNGLTIESARSGSDRWCALSRPFKIWGTYLQGEPPLPPDLPRTTHPSDDAIGHENGASFWTDHGGIPAGESRPVFVLGSVRSGTTAICKALANGTRYQGFAEGHVLDVAIRLINAIAAHFEKKDPWIPPEVSAGYHLGQIGPDRLYAETILLIQRLTAGYTTPYFFDKTPTYQMIASVPILADAWPQARFIFMKRRGIENISSRIRKFGNTDFAASCRDWALIMSSWRAMREIVPGRFLEIDQQVMSTDPAGTAAQVGRLLGLEPPEVAAFATILGQVRPEVTDPAGQIAADLSDLGWSAEQIERFRGICGNEMDAYGYTYDARYNK